MRGCLNVIDTIVCIWSGAHLIEIITHFIQPLNQNRASSKEILEMMWLVVKLYNAC